MMLALFLAAASAAADPAPCDLKSAPLVPVRAVTSHPAPWFDRCVALEGYVDGRLFYRDVAGYYRRHGSTSEDHPNDGWLGLYFPDGGEPPDGLRGGTVVGRLSSCEREYEQEVAEAEPGALVWMVGYCHYHGGLVLLGARLHDAGAASFERQTGDAARRAFGDLVPVRRSAELERLALDFLKALRSGSKTRLRELVGPWDTAEPDTEEERAAFDTLMGGGPGSPLREVRASRRPAIALFEIARSRDDVERLSLPSWAICFCKSGNCRDVWPIAKIDAKLSEALPYACLRVHHRDNDRGQPLELSVATEETLLIEPPRRR